MTSHTVPIGILQAIDAQVIPFDIQPGDHILLMSDGVTDTTLPGDRGDDWLSDILSSAAAGGTITDESALIDSIFAQARARGSCDDMSIISIQISEEPIN